MSFQVREWTGGAKHDKNKGISTHIIFRNIFGFNILNKTKGFISVVNYDKKKLVRNLKEDEIGNHMKLMADGASKLDMLELWGLIV